ncbi:MAG: hypothetical protein GY792_19510 [Gammaproteobacteria bacterium]|nr:hypothetical protein [Gammaproteobacteria bacterium]
MKHKISHSISIAMLLTVLLLSGCGDDKVPERVEERPQAERLFDTQRSALEQVKEAADSAGLRNQRFQERKKELD